RPAPIFFARDLTGLETRAIVAATIGNQRAGSLCLRILSGIPANRLSLASRPVGTEPASWVTRVLDRGGVRTALVGPAQDSVTIDDSTTRTTCPARRSSRGRVGSTREKETLMMFGLKRISTAFGLLAVMVTAASAQGVAPNANQTTADAVAGSLRASRNLA